MELAAKLKTKNANTVCITLSVLVICPAKNIGANT